MRRLFGCGSLRPYRNEDGADLNAFVIGRALDVVDHGEGDDAYAQKQRHR